MLHLHKISEAQLTVRDQANDLLDLKAQTQLSKL